MGWIRASTVLKRYSTFLALLPLLRHLNPLNLYYSAVKVRLMGSTGIHLALKPTITRLDSGRGRPKISLL